MSGTNTYSQSYFKLECYTAGQREHCIQPTFSCFCSCRICSAAVGGAGGHYFCVHNKVVLMSALISKAINGSFGAFLSTLFPLLTLSLCSQQCALFIIHTHVKFYEKYLFCVIFQLEMSLFSPLLSDKHCVKVTLWPVQCSHIHWIHVSFFAQNKIKW